MADRLVVEGLAQRLRRGGDEVMRAQAPILDLFRMAERPARILAAVVPHVAARGDETVADVPCEIPVRRSAGVATRAVDLHPTRPVGSSWRQPHFELDLRVQRWPRSAL